MKATILSPTNEERGSIELPSQFNEEIRSDLIKKAFLVIRSNKRQPYGSDPKAGMKYSAEVSRRRRKYRGSYGIGISRVPRKVMSRRGTRFNWTGAVAPGTVGGRRAHPPKAYKIWTQLINKKENRKAIRAALAATVQKDIVKNRGHEVPDKYPFIIDDSFEKISKTKDVVASLQKIGLEKELIRASVKTIRAGKGTMRGRKYKKTKGPLIVVSSECELSKASRNIPGIDVTSVKKLNAELLAPGAEQGRLTLYTKSAIEIMEKEKLFI